MSHYNAASEGRGGGHAIVLHISSDSAVSIILAAAGNRCSWNRCFMLISTDWERTFQPTVHFSLFPLPIPGSSSSSTAVSCKPVCSIQAPRSHFINQTQPRTSPRSQSTLAAFLGGNASVAVRDAGPIVLKLVRCHNSLRKTAWVGDLFLVSSINCLLERERGTSWRSYKAFSFKWSFWEKAQNFHGETAPWAVRKVRATPSYL